MKRSIGMCEIIISSDEGQTQQIMGVGENVYKEIKGNIICVTGNLWEKTLTPPDIAPGHKLWVRFIHRELDTDSEGKYCYNCLKWTFVNCEIVIGFGDTGRGEMRWIFEMESIAPDLFSIDAVHSVEYQHETI